MIEGSFDYMIRAIVLQTAGYVGGIILSLNKLAIAAPYLAVIGLVATAVIAVKKRRNQILGH